MRELNTVNCPPGAAVHAAPGALHFVLILGSEFSPSLKFRDAAPLTVKGP